MAMLGRAVCLGLTRATASIAIRVVRQEDGSLHFEMQSVHFFEDLRYF